MAALLRPTHRPMSRGTVGGGGYRRSSSAESSLHLDSVASLLRSRNDGAHTGSDDANTGHPPESTPSEMAQATCFPSASTSSARSSSGTRDSSTRNASCHAFEN